MVFKYGRRTWAKGIKSRGKITEDFNGILSDEPNNKSIKIQIYCTYFINFYYFYVSF